MYCVYENSGRYIHGGPLFGGGPLLGGSVIGGSTVVNYTSSVEGPEVPANGSTVSYSLTALGLFSC